MLQRGVDWGHQHKWLAAPAYVSRVLSPQQSSSIDGGGVRERQRQGSGPAKGISKAGWGGCHRQQRQSPLPPAQAQHDPWDPLGFTPPKEGADSSMPLQTRQQWCGSHPHHCLAPAGPQHAVEAATVPVGTLGWSRIGLSHSRSKRVSSVTKKNVMFIIVMIENSREKNWKKLLRETAVI